MRKNMKAWILTAALMTGLSLSACQAAPAGEDKIAETEASSAGTTEAVSTEAGTEGTAEMSDEAEGGEEDLRTALFKSTAYAAQNEITTGKLAENLSYICAFPLKISGLEEEDFYIDSEEDLIQYGVDALYTDELKQAIGEFDVETLKIDGKSARMGDESGRPSIVLTEDADGGIWISEFDY